MRRSLPLLATLAAEVSAVVLLYRFIKEPGFAIPIALGCTAWMLSSTLLYLVASVTRIPAAISATGRVTLPSLRRRVDRALAASILTGAALVGGSPALAAAPLASDPVIDASVVASASEPQSDAASDPPSDAASDTAGPLTEPTPELPVRSGRVGDPEAIVEISTTVEPPLDVAPDVSTSTTVQSTPAPTRESTPDSTSDSASQPEHPAAPVAPSTPTAPTKAPAVVPTGATNSTYTVVAGDNFWEIAARHLAAETGRERGALGANDVVGYWVRVCDANRDRIRSGDVNLIDPGEVVELPSI